MRIQSVFAKSAFAIAISATTLASAFADVVIRDHRGDEPIVRDHRDPKCFVGLPCIREHRTPDVVVPPRPQPPIVVVDPLPRPQPPVIPIDPGIGNGHWNDDRDDDYRISCREGSQIVRENGFRHVRAFDCDGRVYGFRADNRHGGAKIRMTNRGDIISVQYYTY